MVDASTKIPDGLLYGNLVHMGNFDECLSARRGQAGGPSDFDGRHCMVVFQVSLRSDDSRWMKAARVARAELNFLHNMGLRTDNEVKVPVKIAWCAPSSCSPRDLQSAVQALINATEMERIVTVSVEPEQCHTHEGKELRGLDIFAIYVLFAFMALAAGSTVFDVLTRNRVRRHPLALAFSLYSNWPKLIAVTSGGDQLSCLNGIRVISMCWVVLGHAYLLYVNLPVTNYVILHEYVSAPERLFITNGTLVVDTFFLMSGLLLSFLFLKEVRRANRFNVVKFYVHRYIRLTPSLAILLLLAVTIIHHTGTGPLWDTGHKELLESCEKNWWTNILYVNNYVDPYNMCLTHTWYLAVDMQLYWVSPLVLLPLWKLPKKPALLWVCFLLLLGWALPFTIVYLKELHAGLFVGDLATWKESTKYYYWPAHTRYVPWLLGVVLGYVLQEARVKKPHISSWVITLGWILSMVFLFGSVHGAYPFQQPDYEYNRVEAAFWLSLFRGVWALGVAWIIFACDQGYGGTLDKILSCRLFQPIGRLCYGVYLTHVLIMYQITGTVQSALYVNDVNTILLACGILLMSMAWSIPLALLFELPSILIDKVIFGGEREEAQKTDRIYCEQRKRSNEWRIEHGKRW